MLLKKLIFAALITYSGLTVAEAVKPIVITELETYERGSLPRKGAWLGLYCEKLNCEIKNAPVSITSSTGEMGMGLEPIDLLRVSDKPSALFYGVPLQLGKVATWFNAQKLMYKTDRHSKLRKLGSWQMPWGSNPLVISRVKLPEHEGFRYHIGDGTVKQFMFKTGELSHYDEDITPVIHWVGDLDGDGKIDLLLSLPNDCSFDQRLYLSSLASDGELLRKAAQISGMRC
jgi:hypothetical protein